MSKLTTDVVTYVLRPPIKNQNMRTGKYSFTKKALTRRSQRTRRPFCPSADISVIILTRIILHKFRGHCRNGGPMQIGVRGVCLPVILGNRYIRRGRAYDDG